MNKSLGGSMFIHNAVEFDYCITEATASLCELCDEVVVTDCQSTDSTLDLLKECKKQYANLKVIEGLQWDVGDKWNRLVIQANIARSYLTTGWHFMLQADEVIHESSYPYIKEIINDGRWQSAMNRRYNLYGDLNHYLGFDIPHGIKPCNDQVIRLATIENPATGDAEYLGVNPNYITHDYLDRINIFHYGFVRRDKNAINKIIDMQTWFFGSPDWVDQRVVEWKKTSGRFEWEHIFERNHLRNLPMAHPKFSQEWAATRQREKIPVD